MSKRRGRKRNSSKAVRFAPLIKDGGADYLVRAPHGSDAEVIRRFPGAKWDAYRKSWKIPMTPQNTERIKKIWPGAIWLAEEVNRSNFEGREQRLVDAVTRGADEPIMSGIDPSVCEHHRSWPLLFPYQQGGVGYMVSRKSALNSDQMGLGKTVQAIVATDVVTDYGGKKLVVAPKTLLENWADEILQWQHSAQDVYIIGGSASHREELLEEAIESEEPCWVIINWEILRLHCGDYAIGSGEHRKEYEVGSDALLRLAPTAVIADEAHRMKNRNAQMTVTLKKIPTEFRYPLTGTPAMNKPEELWSILHWMEPKKFTSYWRFYEAFKEYDDGYFGRDEKGPKNLDHLGTMLGKRMVRRLKSEVLEDLPPKIHKTIFTPLLPKQRKAYDQMAEHLLTQIDDGTIVTATAAIAKLVRLKQICVSLGTISDEDESAKFDTVMDILDDADSKVVIFSQFSTATSALAKRLVKTKIDFGYLTGSKTAIFRDGHGKKASRGEVVKAFQNDDDIQVYLGTIGAGGVGITLTAADTVIFLDETWTPADMEQAEDRLHRIGQKDSVYVIRLITPDSIEEDIEDMLESKRTTINSLLTRAESVGKDELRRMVAALTHAA